MSCGIITTVQIVPDENPLEPSRALAGLRLECATIKIAGSIIVPDDCVNSAAWTCRRLSPVLSLVHQ
jgi:hypothetical protein